MNFVKWPASGISRASRGLRLGLVALVALVPLGTASAATFHLVQPGDTLSQIAARYGVPLDELAALNGIEDPNFIREGAELSLDAPAVGTTSYTVQQGDALSLIANSFGVLLRDLVELNGIGDPDHIVIGETLTIPGKAVVVPSHEVSRDVAGDALRQAEAEYGLPSGVLLALAWQESGWQQSVVSEAGAVGLTQVLPSTAAWALEWLAPHATDWETDPYHNADMGAAILRHWYRLSDGDLEMALAAYYQGWHSVETVGVFKETKQYVANVLALRAQFN